MELLLSDDANEQAHLFQNFNAGVSEQTVCPAEMEFKVFPNPILTRTAMQLSYTLQQPAFVEVKLYDCSGAKIATLFNQKVNSGFHKEKALLTQLPTGVYFLHLNVENESVVKKIVVIK